MSTNIALDLPAGSAPPAGGGPRGDGTDGNAAPKDGTAGTTLVVQPVPRLQVGAKTRFLSADYPIPFPPLERPLSFDDVRTWPDDPMRVFSQWYADSEFEYNKLSPQRMDAPAHWPNTMQIATVTSAGFPAVRTVLLKGFDARGLVFFTNYEGAKGRQLLADPRVSVVFYWKTLERQVRFEGIAEPLSSQESDAYFRRRPIESQIGGTVSPQSRPIASHADLEQAYVLTVQGVAEQVEAHLAKTSQAAAGDGQASAAELEATRARVADLLAKLSVQAAAASPCSTVRSFAFNSASAPSALSPEQHAESHKAHALALASLQRLEASELTRPVLHSLVHRPPHWGGFLIRPISVEFWCDGAYRLHSRCVYRMKGRNDQVVKSVPPTAPHESTGEAAWTKIFLAP